ncbi:hypothetical protein GJ496_010070 [Pomphorhynchus laevis]|nr:hypothetical protein GJ496_010070 [Pomphorhynchus laevis]
MWSSHLEDLGNCRTGHVLRINVDVRESTCASSDDDDDENACWLNTGLTAAFESYNNRNQCGNKLNRLLKILNQIPVRPTDAFESKSEAAQSTNECNNEFNKSLKILNQITGCCNETCSSISSLMDLFKMLNNQKCQRYFDRQSHFEFKDTLNDINKNLQKIALKLSSNASTTAVVPKISTNDEIPRENCSKQNHGNVCQNDLFSSESIKEEPIDQSSFEMAKIMLSRSKLAK